MSSVRSCVAPQAQMMNSQWRFEDECHRETLDEKLEPDERTALILHLRRFKKNTPPESRRGIALKTYRPLATEERLLQQPGLNQQP